MVEVEGEVQSVRVVFQIRSSVTRVDRRAHKVALCTSNLGATNKYLEVCYLS